jgi:hypothetical protein
MKTVRWCWGFTLGLSLCGCGVAGDLESFEAEGSIGSVEEALRAPEFERVSASRFSPAAGIGRVKVECSGDFPYLLGTAALAEGTLSRIEPGGARPTDLEIEAAVDDQEKKFTAEAVCSDANGELFHAPSSTGERTRECPSGMIAVGGGALCHGSGRLYRSRPSPDDDGSTPTGWAAGCTTGSIDTYAICVEKAVGYDFRGCRTERKDGTGSVEVDCPASASAVSAGGYCGGKTPLSSMDLSASGATVKCNDRSASVHGYVVCCG